MVGKSKISLGVLFLFVFVWNEMYSQIGGNSQINFVEGQTRYSTEIQVGFSKFQICNLDKGEQYEMHITNISEGNVRLTDRESDNSKLKFRTKNNCHEFNLSSEVNSQETTLPIVVSIECVSCAKPRQKMMPQCQGISATLGNVNTLVESFSGDCVKILNEKYEGDESAIGWFINGSTSIGLDEGIVLATGNVESLVCGPNNVGGMGVVLTGDAATGDADLAALIEGISLNDVAILEFDFIPANNFVEFEYVFASEEYPEWVCSEFNDLFGFFISGPGINGSFENGAINIAQVYSPRLDSNIIVSINTINNGYAGGSNIGCEVGPNGLVGDTIYYVNNIGGDSTQFDGFTKVLRASYGQLQPCKTYHIKLVIADASDSSFDSAVFLKANSFNAGAVKATAYSPATDSNLVYEGCANGYFEFVRIAGDNSFDLPVTCRILPTSTATLGSDFTIETEFKIKEGLDTHRLYPNVLLDNYNEGEETIILEYDPPCSCDENSTTTLVIVEGCPKPCTTCPTSFAPIPGKEYFLSAWTKEGNDINVLTYEHPEISIQFPNPIEANTFTVDPFKPSGPIIEGWQKIEGRFTVPEDAVSIEIILGNTGSDEVYFDDIRVHPVEANMKSFVYDPVSMRLVAELDENNFFTKYEYNKQGKLTRIKKETERGVKTIQESRQGPVKKE